MYIVDDYLDGSITIYQEYFMNKRQTQILELLTQNKKIEVTKL